MDYSDRVREGAALLDERRPGWRGAIDVERLDLGSCFNCVLGQLYGQFGYGMLTLLDVDDDELTNTDRALARALGFIADSAPYGWDTGSRATASVANREAELALREAWLEVIRGDDR